MTNAVILFLSMITPAIIVLLSSIIVRLAENKLEYMLKN